MRQDASPRSSDVRFIGALMGRYLLASRKNRTHRVQVFACRLQSISPQLMVASAPVLGAPGEELSANFEPFGTVRGRVARLIDGGFSMAIEANSDERDLLVKRIGWYKKKVFQGVADKRAHRRLMPRDPRSTILFGDGSRLPCLTSTCRARAQRCQRTYSPISAHPWQWAGWWRVWCAGWRSASPCSSSASRTPRASRSACTCPPAPSARSAPVWPLAPRKRRRSCDASR